MNIGKLQVDIAKLNNLTNGKSRSAKLTEKREWEIDNERWKLQIEMKIGKIEKIENWELDWIIEQFVHTNHAWEIEKLRI